VPETPAATPAGEILAGVLSPDIYLKSRRTQVVMIRRLQANLRAALGPGATVSRIAGHRVRLAGETGDAAERAARVFGISSIERMAPLEHAGFDDLCDAVAADAAERVAGRSFAVRVRRRGTHGWNSYDAACRIGDLLREAGGTVDLDDPDVTVGVHVRDDWAAIVRSAIPGPGGLPLGSQDTALSLVSGGIDSPVAAWMLMSRGCPVDVLHFTLDCGQADHALAVAYRLWQQWGAGSNPVTHVVDLRPAVDSLVSQVGAGMRQVALKALMMRAASLVAGEEHLAALVTGESLGQVSSQTLVHLGALTETASVPVMRPLVGLSKQEIVARARAIGTYDLSARAREVCDLSAGAPVEVAARPARVAATADRVPEDLWRDAVAKRQRFLLADWAPGMTGDDGA
jgi:thiamine biosynthesis protein ThiI